MCLHGALCSISFNLIRNTTTIKKKSFDPLRNQDEDVSMGNIFATLLLHGSFPLI